MTPRQTTPTPVHCSGLVTCATIAADAISAILHAWPTTASVSADAILVKKSAARRRGGAAVRGRDAERAAAGGARRGRRTDREVVAEGGERAEADDEGGGARLRAQVGYRSRGLAGEDEGGGDHDRQGEEGVVEDEADGAHLALAAHHHRGAHGLDRGGERGDDDEHDAEELVRRVAAARPVEREDGAADEDDDGSDDVPRVPLLLEHHRRGHRDQRRRPLDHLVDEEGDERERRVVARDVDRRAQRERKDTLPAAFELLEARRWEPAQPQDDRAADARRHHVPRRVENWHREPEPFRLGREHPVVEVVQEGVERDVPYARGHGERRGAREHHRAGGRREASVHRKTDPRELFVAAIKGSPRTV